MKKLVSFTALVVAILFAVVSAQAASNKYRIKFNHEAKKDGVLVLKLTPGEGEPITVEVELRDGINENRAANKVESALKDALDRGDYNVERDDFEDVLVKAKMGTKNFDLEIVENTADGLDVKIRKE